MFELSLIVAAAQNNAIGVNNELPWRLSADLKYFKALTTGNAVIMGRKTYDSIGKPLPNRINLVVTRNEKLELEGVIIKKSLLAAVEYCKDSQVSKAFIIGGDSIYKQSLELVSKIYLTRVHTIINNADAFFPELDQDWILTQKQDYTADEKNEWDYTFEIWEKTVNE